MLSNSNHAGSPVKKFATTFFCTLLFSIPALAQQVTFERQQYSKPANLSMSFSIDLNGDNVSDLVSLRFDPQPQPSGQEFLNIRLANGDGSFRPPTEYLLGPGTSTLDFSIVSGDFNRDGKADLALNYGGKVQVFLGRGDGTFHSPVIITGSSPICELQTADFNHDAKLDLAIASCALGQPEGTPIVVSLMLGNGDGTFSAPRQVFQTSSSDLGFENMVVGNFDGDNNADLAGHSDSCDRSGVCQTTFIVLYGDGKGNFAALRPALPGAFYHFVVADVNSDGRSDILSGREGGAFDTIVLYGNTNRTFSLNKVSDLAPGILQVADFNGDKILDVAALTGNEEVIALGLAGGGFAPGQHIPFSNETSVSSASSVAGYYNKDMKPDLAATQIIGGGLTMQPLFDLLNTTSGQFPPCSPPGSFGIHVCSPISGTTSGSPVRFRITAASFTPIRKIELWIDGVKKGETYRSFNLYAFCNPTLTVASGSHRADIFAVNYDGMLQHKTVFFTVP
jgi:hypothetical protein